MTVRITTLFDGHPTVVRVAGRLELEDLPELDREILSIGGGFVLELSELLSADNAGINRLLELASLGVQHRGASNYVEMLLQDGK